MQHQQSVVLKEEEEGRSRSRGKSKGDPSSSEEEQEQERRKLVEGGVVEEVGLGNININIKKVRHPHTIRYIEKKMADKGIHRMDRHPADGLSLAHAPPKSGHGGKFTWEGPIHTELDPVPPAIDPRDPNYVPDDDNNNDDVEKVVEEAAAAEKPLVIGEVEVAKTAEAKAGVSRIEVHPPLSSSTAD